MIGPPLPPADPWDTGPGVGGAAAWRERERRQRSVRLLMMFLLMLLLMDGEEHQARQRRGDYKKLKPPKPLEESVFQARTDQDERIHKIMRNHKRYKSLVEKNGENVDLEVRKWVDQQQELQKDTFDTVKARVKEDPENEKTVHHFPWNSTGFYRGEWVREGPVPEEEEEQGEDKGTETKVKEEEEQDEEVKVVEKQELKSMDPVDLERPMKDSLKERNENIGVFLLPQGTKMNMGNFTELKTETASARAAAQSLRETAKRAPQSPFLRVNHNAEVDSLVKRAFGESSNSTPHVTLSKPSGRAAFQFYSRSIPAMKEISLVDGLVKLYDSSTVGYSTRRDILLRARGVMIHSIGRLSLVSNADPGRSAFVVFDDKKKEEDETAASHRRLQKSVDALENGHANDENIEQIRNDVLSLYPFDSQNDDLEKGGWEMTSFDLNDALFVERFDEGDDIRGMRDVLYGLLGSDRRRLSEEVTLEEFESEGAEDTLDLELQDTDGNSEDATASKTLPRTLEDLEDVDVDVETADLTPTSFIGPPLRSSITKSSVIVPYPFVPDDKEESIRKAKTPLAKKMQARDQLLEVNAGRCEFEINLDVEEVEWTIGQWRKMMTRMVKESNQLDPSVLRKDGDEIDKDDDEENSGKAAHTRTKHSRSHPRSTPLRGRLKPPQDQALVMTLLGEIHSPNCDFTASLNATAIRTDWEHTTGKAINYSFYMMLACLVQIVVLLRQLLHTQSQSAATRVSLLSVGWQTVVDALVCLAHIYLSLAMQPLFTAFASVAFFKLLIFCVIEMKYMAIIIQARNTANGGQNTTEMLRRQVAMLHLRFYVALVGSFLAFFYAGTEYRTVYILALYSFWVPQIIQNIITEAKRPLHSYYIYGMSITRLLAPLYIFAVPNNFLKEVYPDAPTNVFMCELLVLWVGIQTAILVAQGKYGARFMIPSRFLPPKFDYSRPIPASMLPPGALELSPSESSFESERPQEVQSLLPSDGPASPDRHMSSGARNRIKGNRAVSRSDSTSMTSEPVQQQDSSHSLDCVICYNGIDVHNRKGYMLAPCNHIYHRECLVEWMNVKMECPVCRTELPSI